MLHIITHITDEAKKHGVAMTHQAYARAAGFDLPSTFEVVVPPGQRVRVGTGHRFLIPAGFYGDVTGRSGNNAAGHRVERGVIDSGYTGEVMVVLHNDSETDWIVKPGDRIAQILFLPVPDTKVYEMNEEVFDMIARQAAQRGSIGPERGANGFGSSG